MSEYMFKNKVILAFSFLRTKKSLSLSHIYELFMKKGEYKNMAINIVIFNLENIANRC